MDALSHFFQANLDVIYFVYGAGFAAMGLVGLLQPKKNSGFPLADKLFLLGWFGVIHGLNEWLDMWTLVRRPESAIFYLAKFSILTLSYVFLLEFGRRSLREGEGGCAPLLAKAARMLSWQLVPALLLLTAGLAAASSTPIKNAFILPRYLLGFPGATLAGAAFLGCYRRRALELNKQDAMNYFSLAGIGFLFYGILGGLVTPKGGFFPASVLNRELFLSLTGFPVELFRAACGVIISWGIIRTLRIFNWERDEIINGVVFNNSLDCIASISLDGKFLAVNRTCFGAYEVDGPWELAGKASTSYFSTGTKEFSEAVKYAADGGDSTLKYKTTGKKGREVWWEAVVSPVRGLDGKIKSVLCVARDITEQIGSEERIKRSQEAQAALNAILGFVIENVSLESVLEQVLDHILSIPWLGVQKKGAVLLMDPVGRSLIMKAQRGLPGDIVRACASVQLGHCLCGTAAMSGKTVFAADMDERHETRPEGMQPHGHYCLPVKSRGRVTGVLTIYLPAGHKYAETERDFLEAVCAIIAKMVDYKALEARTFQIQKMESLGRFAGSMAHDFNNILTGIKGFNALAQDTVPGTSPAQRYLKETASGIDRGAGLMQQILSFSRSQPSEMSDLDLNAVITSMEPMLKMLLTQKIRLKFSLAEGLPGITGNKSQLEQIVVNLAVNARDAMPKGGEFSITTGQLGPEADVRCLADINPGAEAVRLSVADNGNGIPGRLLERVFEPFFTTKPEGGGTGLGLSTVYSLVKLHKGGITVTSLEGRGTTFDICLPAGAGPAPEGAKAAKNPGPRTNHEKK